MYMYRQHTMHNTNMHGYFDNSYFLMQDIELNALS